MRIKIAGKYWDFRVTNSMQKTADGECDEPTSTCKQIRVRPRVFRSDERCIEVVLHEVLHAAGWPIEHDLVTTYARDAARLLCALGFSRDTNTVPDKWR